MLYAGRRPMGRLFYWLLGVLLFGAGVFPLAAKAADGAPGTTRVSEGLFGSHTGEQKKESAITFVSAALQLNESVANREVVDEAKFKSGLGKIIDGTVDCLNSSSWAHPQ